MPMYKFYAMIDRENLDGTGHYMVSFPDVENCFTYGEDMQGAVSNAHDALRELLIVEEQRGKEIPKASKLPDLELKQGASYVLIEVNTDVKREAV